MVSENSKKKAIVINFNFGELYGFGNLSRINILLKTNIFKEYEVILLTNKNVVNHIQTNYQNNPYPI